MQQQPEKQKKSRYPLSQFFGEAALLFFIWIVLSGRFELKFILTGLIGSILITCACRSFLTVYCQWSGHQFFMLRVNPIKAILYGLWLVKEIAKASLDTAKLVLSPKMNYTPQLVYFSMPFDNPAAAVLLANSITLTPGTITIDFNPSGIFTVHALTEEAGAGILTGEMANRVAEVYGDHCTFTDLCEMTEELPFAPGDKPHRKGGRK